VKTAAEESKLPTPLALARIACGLPQAELGAKAGTSRFTIARLEQRRGRPRLRTAQSIAAALDLPLDLVFPDYTR
jgi:DNA-binding XRE family transcriptional regulator